jgi:FMN-dependent oxidoreductase (nitrilotriacetate monooxygenase family)
MSKQMHLVLLVTAGPAPMLWQHPADANRFLDPDYWDSLARTLENARFDAIFFADGSLFHDDIAAREGGEIYLVDPLPLAMSIARATKHLGIGITASSGLHVPYSLARALGTVDLLSGGRLAWNVVTSDRAASLYGREALKDRISRYDRAEELVEACVQLWESFSRDAVAVDKRNGVMIDTTKLRKFEYSGKHVSTRGPLTVPASPQGRPIIMQAGASDRGRSFAARWAEAVFSQEYSLVHMRAYYDDVKRRALEFGRSPDDCRIFSQVTVFVGETEAIARAKSDYVNGLMSDGAAISKASAHIGVNLRDYDPDKPMPDVPTNSGTRSAYDKMLEVGSNEGLSLVQVARRYAFDSLSPQIIGSPERVADQLQELFEQGVCDGFMLNAKVRPGAVEDFTRMVVPILQERGLFRTEYPGTTLRETLRT